MVRQQKNEELMAAGVTLVDPATTYVDADVVVGPDTVIYPCVPLEGSTTIGAACEIHSGSRIVNSTVGDRVMCAQPHCGHRFHSREPALFSVPFAHLRPDSHVGEDAHIGQFRRTEEDDDRQGRKGEPPRLPRRRGHRREDPISAPAPSPATTTARRSTRRRLATTRSWAATARSSPRSPSAMARTSQPARRSPPTCPPARWQSAGRARKTRTGGSPEAQS